MARNTRKWHQIGSNTLLGAVIIWLIAVAQWLTFFRTVNIYIGLALASVGGGLLSISLYATWREDYPGWRYASHGRYALASSALLALGLLAISIALAGLKASGIQTGVTVYMAFGSVCLIWSFIYNRLSRE